MCQGETADARSGRRGSEAEGDEGGHDGRVESSHGSSDSHGAG